MYVIRNHQRYGQTDRQTDVKRRQHRSMLSVPCYSMGR